MTSFAEMLRNITPEVYASLKTAVEIGKWAMIAWEQDNLPEEQRTGYMGPQSCKSEAKTVPNILFSTGSDTLH